MKKLLKLFLFVLTSGYFSFTQQNHINFEHIGIEDGLSQSTVTGITQDKKGYLWFATQDGINRYDGYTIKSYKQNPRDSLSLSNNNITCVKTDSKGKIWIGTNGGISRYDPELNIFNNFYSRTNDNSISNDKIYVIFEDYEKNIWIGTDKGLHKFDSTGQSFIRYEFDKKDLSRSNSTVILSIYEDSNRNFWIGTDHGLHKFNRKKEKFNSTSIFEENTIKEIFEDSKGELWIGTEGDGLKRIGPQGNIIESYQPDSDSPNSISGPKIEEIYQDSEGQLWIGTYKKGLNRFNYDKNNFTSYKYEPGNTKSPQGNTIRSIFEDREGNLWIGTSSGVSYYNIKLSSFTHYHCQSAGNKGLSNDDVWETYKDKNKNIIWIGTNEGGLNKFSPAKDTFYAYQHEANNPNSLASNTVYSVFQDSKNNFWVGTSNGLDLFDPQSGTFQHFRENDGPNSLSNNIVSCIYEDSRGVLWVGTKVGLNKFDYQNKNFIRFGQKNEETNLGNYKIYTIYEDSENFVWIGTAGGGLYKYNYKEGSFKNFRHNPDDTSSLSDNVVISINEGPEGDLWIGTGKGLNRYLGDNEGFEAFYEVDGLADDMIYGIQADAYGNLWMSTNQGITKYNRLSGKFKNYSQEAGLYISEFNMGAYCKDQDGRLYFGGIDGFTVFDPRKIRDNEYIPPVTITDFLLFNRSVDIRGKTSGNDILTLDKNISFTNSLTLDHNDYIFSFEFSALTFWHSDKNKYQYKLEGFDKEWITTDSRHRRATYTNIPPGEYTFMVRASNSDGYWSKKPAAIDVRIVPPFWKTKTFLGLIILAFIVIVIGTFQYRTYQIKTRNKLLEEKVKERTKEIQAQTEELKKLSIVASKTDNAIAITDPDGNFEWINDGFTRLYGWTIEELVTEFNGSLINFSSADNIEQFIDNCVKRGESVRYETKSTTKAKNLIYSQTTLTPIFDDRGVIKKLIAIDTDITDLEKAREEAEQANKAKSEFLANMSHEIRTPLNGIIGFTDLLMEMDLNDTQFEYMETVNNSANALLGLINDILDFSKIEAGKLELNEEKTDIIEMSENTVDMFKNRAHEKELELLLNLSPDIPRYVYVDSVRLRQILVNLVGNAVKFTREGEVEYKIETGQAEKKGEMTFTFSVLDTGIGVSKSKQNKIFDSFTQADASTTRKYGGTGLGLSISNRLLNKMGSKLEIESEPGAGSRFYFTVTLKIAEKAKVGNGNFDLDKILIADHNQKNQKILSRILQKLDLNTDQAAKGSEVLAFIEEKGPYDLLFLDHQMPDIDGLKVIKIIRQEMQLTADQQPIVLLHNSSVTNNIRKKCKKLDVLMSMVKPVKMTRLFPLLDEMGNGKKPDKKTQKEASFSGADNYFKASYKILIAEDNKTNMLFATTVVKKLLPNAEILEAKNGKKAVNLYKEHSNDLDMIFMDIQMPEMNGYQVTRTIRAMEETGKIPIIALTAGTVKGEREKCEKAGMDDFISKPVKAEIVKETIIKWLSDIPTEEKAGKNSEGISEKVNNVKNELQAYPVFDYEDLSNRLMEDRELIEELVASTIDEFPAQIDNLKELLKNGHGEKIELQAHSIKGSASNISAKALTLVALKIEKASENNQFELAKELVPELERQFQVLKNKVKKKISQEY